MLRAPITAALCALCGPVLSAQTLYFEDFSSGAPGWTLEALCCGLEWDVDALPATTPSGPYYSAPVSLNFNDDVDYGGGWGTAAATSPPIDLSAATGIPTVVFWCNNKMTEGTCDAHERASFLVVDRFETCVGFPPWPEYLCPQTFWHPHQMVLDPSWGSIQLSFELHTDGLFDYTEGWFIDDVGVYDAPAPIVHCTPKTNWYGCDPHASWAGALPSATDPDRCLVFCTGVAAQQIGVFFYGTNGRAEIPFLGGTLCAAPPLRRTVVQASGGSHTCSGFLAIDFNAWIRSGADPGLVPGTRVDGQWWFRDPPDSFGAGLSDGIEFVIQP